VILIIYLILTWTLFEAYKPTWEARLRIGQTLDALFWIRAGGAITYFVYAYFFSNGSVDAFVYDNWGTFFADKFATGDFSPLYDVTQWRNAEFLGTNFVAYPNAIFFLITGYDTLTTYYLFSLVAWMGIMMALVGVRNAVGASLYSKAVWWMVLIPSFWFWNSTIGKDSFTFLGAGMVVYGVACTSIWRKIFWITIGTLISYAFREPFGLLLLIAVGLSSLFDARVNARQRIILAVLGASVLIMSGQALRAFTGLQSLELAEVNAQLEAIHNNTNYGGGVIEPKTFSPQGIIQSYIDVFLRPFVWEVRSIGYALAFIETALVALLLFRLIFKMNFLENLKRDNLFRFFVISIILFGLAVGLTEVNIGIILRHRSVIHVFVAGAYVLVRSKQYLQFRRVKQSKVKPFNLT
jgi:hypothetical protein